MSTELFNSLQRTGYHPVSDNTAEEIYNFFYASLDNSRNLENIATAAEHDFKNWYLELLIKHANTFHVLSNGMPVYPIKKKANHAPHLEEEWSQNSYFFTHFAPFKASRNSILFLGPNSFREQVWDIRMEYIFPDIYAPLGEVFDLYMLVPLPPLHARESLIRFCKKYSVTLLYFLPYPGIPLKVSWIMAANHVTKTIQPDIVSNIQGHTFFGDLFSLLKKENTRIKSILRVAGDELESRISIGSIKKDTEMAAQLAREMHTLRDADAVIVMSDWEYRRVEKLLDKHEKLSIIHRGVDTKRFTPTRPKDNDKRQEHNLKLLFIGRKSEEKGWDSFTLMAQNALAMRLPMEFIMAGPGFDTSSYDNCKEVGFVSPQDLPQLMRSVDGIVVFSKSESLGQVILEAVSSGTYCFVNNDKYTRMFKGCPLIVEFFQDGEDTTQEIYRVLSNSTEKVIQQGVNYAQTHLEADIYKDKLKYFFQKVAQD